MPTARRFMALLCLACILLPATACVAAQEQGEPYGDPQRFEKAIKRFEKQDKQSPPPKGAVVCVGSSSMRMWGKRLGEDLSPLTVVPRGFGGSNMNDLLHYLDRVVLAYEPRAVLIYEGDNDIGQGVSPRLIEEAFAQLVEAIHEALPGCRVYVLSIKPSPKRWALWPKMVDANRRLKRVCERDKRLTFIDVAGPMLGDDGKPIPELFVKDQLHMSPAGYDVWREVVRPVVVVHERRYEADPQESP